MTSAGSEAENTSPLVFLDRYILVVTPLQPFVDWVRKVEVDQDELEEGDAPFDLEAAQQDFVSTYLVPTFPGIEMTVAWVRQNFDLIFEHELASMYTAEALWPENRTFEMMEEWFDLVLLESPLDIVNAPLVAEG